ncbi:lung adenoma susceptibility protein 2 [Osmerus mordax]|uniref:lung adenoma susceptibility protein 2 n=1 Tax=Osmerus mordax TaxID=8014 RepID=UPI00350F87E5
MTSQELNSPESTVTSLLASSGHLRSSLHHEPMFTVRYRDKDFESASAALDAYIADFERSELKRSPTRIQLLTDRSTSSFPIRSRVRNKDVLQEQLTDTELDFLTLPVRVHRQDTDRLSVTTDDLLVLPCNGSLPITRTSAFLSQSGGQSGSYCLSQHAHSNSSNRHRPRQSSTDIACAQHSACYNLLRPRQQAKRAPTSETSTGLGLKSSQPTHHQGLKQTSERDPASPHHYPRWMTSQKADMDMSGITSIPDTKYPAWIQECGLPIDTPTHKSSHKKTLTSSQTRPRSPKVPYWLGELEASYEKLQMDSVGYLGASSDSGDLQGEPTASPFKGEARPKTLRQLFAEQPSQTAGGDCRDMDNLFRDDKLERLILKAEAALSSPSLGLSRPRQPDVDPPNSSEDSLEVDRSWDNPTITFKSPVPVGGADSPAIAERPFNDRNEEAKGSCSSGYSSRKAPGPVEALKQMLFSLQAVEQQVSQPSADQGPDTAVSDTRHTVDGWTDRNMDSEAETAQITGTEMEAYDTAPGGQSLQRALHHLGRLKSLVEDHHEKNTPEGNAS